MIKGLVKNLKKRSEKNSKKAIHSIVIPRADHSISRKDIHPNALKVLYRLHTAKYEAFLVGGCVRDLLLGHHPKDFDIATDAHPEEIQQLFRNCRLIGKRFRLAHILFGKDIIEVATFRTHHENAEQEHHAKMQQGMIIRDNVYGDIEDDVFRRDFTINGLYYNIADFSVVDYVDGMKDIHSRTLRLIGDPEKRYLEDPVRMLRAIRFMGKLSLNIHAETEKHIFELRHLLQKVSSARLYLEVMKIFQQGAILPTFRLLAKYKLTEELFPAIHAYLEDASALQFIENALSNTDQRIKEEKTVSPAFLFAVLTWPLIEKQIERLSESKLPAYIAHEQATHQSISQLIERLALPRFLLLSIREICLLQFRFTQRFGNRPYRLLSHQRFRAAYDLLILRGSFDSTAKELESWWTAFAEASDTQKTVLLKELEKTQTFKKRRPKKKKIPQS